MAPEYKVTTTDMPFNGRPKPNDQLLESLIRDNAPPITRRASMPVFARYPIALSMLTVGMVLWTLGAGASLDGWIIGINLISSVRRLSDVPIPLLSGMIQIPLIALVGLLYSCNELFLRPKRTYSLSTNIAVVMLILLTHATDVGSTYLSVTTLRENAWELQTWAANLVVPAAIYSVFLTYVPELLILQAVKMFRGR